MMKNTIHERNLFQVTECSLISCFFASFPANFNTRGVARARSRRETLRAGLLAPPDADRRDEGEESHSASKQPGSPVDRRATSPAQHRRGVGSRAVWASLGPSRLEGSASSGGYPASVWTP